MGREVNRLSARKVQTLSEPGMHADGGGLYLAVEPAGTKRWIFRYRFSEKRRDMGLGPAQTVPLIRARELASEARALILSGVDPVEARKAAKAEATKAKPAVATFGDVANVYMADRAATWRNDKHRAQWRQTLEVQAAALWAMPVADITMDDVLAVLRPLWTTKPETANRIRGRVEAVIDAALVRKQRVAENPARWRGLLEKVLPRQNKLVRGHFGAMPYADVPGFCLLLSQKSGMAALALRFAILTAARSGEVRGMTWGEVDFDARRWVVPATRMKAKREHRVPLTEPALAILADLRPERPALRSLVFPSQRNTPLSDMALTMLLRKAGLGAYTAHGFRSSFRDWVTEETEFPGDLAEAALAHLTGDETERAYRRGDALEKRRRLMDHWADFVTGALST